MKFSLTETADLVTDLTGITLSQMRSTLSFQDIVTAKQLFIILARDYAIWKNKEDITDFINTAKSQFRYAEKVSYKREIVNYLNEAKKIIKERSNTEQFQISSRVNNMEVNERISFVNNIIQNIPKHKRIYLTL